ncbi:hypothetical protein PG984_010199 [Apiospora sp. TS-2023a]
MDVCAYLAAFKREWEVTRPDCVGEKRPRGEFHISARLPDEVQCTIQRIVYCEVDNETEVTKWNMDDDEAEECVKDWWMSDCFPAIFDPPRFLLHLVIPALTTSMLVWDVERCTARGLNITEISIDDLDDDESEEDYSSSSE